MDQSASSTSFHNLKDPNTLNFQRPVNRRLILASYWIVIFLAIPFWWRLTSIERKGLPSTRVHSQLERRPIFPVHVQVDPSSFRERAPILATDLNKLLARSTRVSSTWQNLDIHVDASHNEGDQIDTGMYILRLGNVTAIQQPRYLTLSEEDASSAVRVADLLTALLAPETSSPVQRVAQYAKRYRLAFTLLNEDAASAQLISAWDIRAAIAGKCHRPRACRPSTELLLEHLSPILSRLDVLHEFVIESQIQFHAPLAFEPTRTVFGNNTLYGLTPADLSVFVNSAEWTLSSSISEDPVLHFVLFVPSTSRRPLRILDANGTSTVTVPEHITKTPAGSPTRQTAFLLPQWGGIYIYNGFGHDDTRSKLTAVDLGLVFSAFANQLSALLGVPPLPSGMVVDDSSILTDWQLDSLLRNRALENIIGSQQTLYSIVKLVEQIGNMPVDETVKGDVQNALTALDQAYRSTPGPPVTALQWSSEALSQASHAFFNPGMLALLYFPAEHKYAVYTPLFASIAVPLIVALGRELYAWRKEYRTATSG